MTPAFREGRLHRNDNKHALEKIHICSLSDHQSSACELTSGTVWNDGKDFTAEELVMVLGRFRREGGCWE